MKAKQLLETLKLTYDFDDAREVSAKMVAAAYPEASGEDARELQMMVMSGFQLGNVPVGIADWTAKDIVEFFLDDDLVNEVVAPNVSYNVVDELMLKMSERSMQVNSEEERLCFPFWFRYSYAKRLQQKYA